MTFFQNVFNADFQGNLVLGDRQHIPTFSINKNAGRGDDLVIAWNAAPYDLNGTDSDGGNLANLTLAFALHNTQNWTNLTVNASTGAANANAVTSAEAAAALNDSATFAAWFTAVVTPGGRLTIRQRRTISEFKFYVVNGGAEESFGFNARAGVAELPTYFARHTIENRSVFTDSAAMLIELDPASNNVDAAIIDNAVNAQGVSLEYDSSTVREDWELLDGRSGIFNFTKNTVNSDDQVTEKIEYPAGAVVGDLARKTTYTYADVADKNPTEVTEVPYTLESGDLITP